MMLGRPAGRSARRSVGRLLCSLWAVLLAGCASMGPAHLEATHSQFGESLNQSSREELLLNLLRLHFDDTPVFLQVHSITTSPKLSTEMTATGLFGGSGASLGSASIGYTDSPTIIYMPTDGQRFVQSLLEPLDVRMLAIIVEAGWDLRTVFSLAVESLNGLRNPNGLPEHEGDEAFDHVVARLDALHRAGRLRVTIPPVSATGDAAIIITLLEDEASLAADVELRALLRVEPTHRQLQLRHGLHASGATVSVLTRPLQKVLRIAGSGVEMAEVGEQALERGLVGIRRSADAPAEANVRVMYRGDWYFIDVDDRRSQRNLTLLRQMVTLQSVDIPYDSLSVTILD